MTSGTGGTQLAQAILQRVRPHAHISTDRADIRIRLYQNVQNKCLFFY